MGCLACVPGVNINIDGVGADMESVFGGHNLGFWIGIREVSKLEIV